MPPKIVVGVVTIVLAGVGCSSAAEPNMPATAPGVATAGAAGGGAGAALPAAATPTGVPSTTASVPSATPSGMVPVAAAPSGALPATTPASSAGGTPSTTGAQPGVVPPAGGALPAATGKPISEECRGFDFNGIQYSPGGEVLPNKCEAFHATLNNPYAVRCVDVWPWYKTKYVGDQYCVLPPAPGKGIQFGHHPQGEFDAWFKAVSQGDMSGYDKVPEGWEMQPGGEEERNINIRHMNEGGKYDRSYARMRGGSHHMIASTVTSGGATFMWSPGGPEGLFGGTGVPGAQRPDENSPQSAKIPVENDGLYREVAANATVTYNMHHFNSTDKPILKEAWQNLWWSENPKTPIGGINGLPVQQVVDVFANPGEIVDVHYGYTVPGALRILGVFGHRHAWTTNFTAWVKRAGKEGPEIIYQSFDWFDEPTFQYNSEITNPKPDPANRLDAAYSGILELKTGDELHFNCHIEYTDARAKEENSPVTPSQNGPLRFANQAYNAEMCILFGGGVGTPGDMARMGAPPDFAKMR